MIASSVSSTTSVRLRSTISVMDSKVKMYIFTAMLPVPLAVHHLSMVSLGQCSIFLSRSTKFIFLGKRLPDVSMLNEATGQLGEKLKWAWFHSDNETTGIVNKRWKVKGFSKTPHCSATIPPELSSFICVMRNRLGRMLMNSCRKCKCQRKWWCNLTMIHKKCYWLDQK